MSKQVTKRLFTPGPLTTSRSVKEAMLVDIGSRENDFIKLIKEVRNQLLELGRTTQEESYEAVLLQGSGTFGVEAVLSSAIPAQGKLLVLINGAYGERMVTIAQRHRIEVVARRWREHEPVNPALVREALAEDQAVTHVAVVHCETTTGLVNPIDSIGQVVRDAKRTFIVDAMSSFGAIPLSLPQAQIDFLISSANKCIEGVPGFSFVLARREALESCEGNARTVSLDLYEQWRGLESNGQFRFTPPTHAILAFAQALAELKAEGGVAGRARRYQQNHAALMSGMSKLGFKPYLPAEHQSWIISAFYYPNNPAFVFEEFYRKLAELDFIIYPGKLGRVPCFRIGNIGRLYPVDIEALLVAIRSVLNAMGVIVPVSAP